MSGFSPEWLALREPADHQARSIELREKLQAYFAGRDELRIVDLGCGSGSNLRALAPHLAATQHWRLVDYDPALLSAAREALKNWADMAQEKSGVLHLQKNDKFIVVSFDQVDLARDLERLLADRADLVTAAAFFDLVSEDWIERFCKALAAHRLPFFTVLTYDGTDRWSPAHPQDAAMVQAFHAHQGSDKGFGKAAGPRATDVLQKALTQLGYAVTIHPTPWKLDAAQRKLMNALSDGFANAVAETGLVAKSDIEDWRRARLSAATCAVGHYDLLGLPSID